MLGLYGGGSFARNFCVCMRASCARVLFTVRMQMALAVRKLLLLHCACVHRASSTGVVVEERTREILSGVVAGDRTRLAEAITLSGWRQ